jgi:Aldehyde dehydrogenase family/Integrase core domain
LLDAGLPKAAIAVVFGVAEEVSHHLIPAAAVAKITFTGSIAVGKLLAAAAGEVMKPVTMELGGHAPAIVCGDADPEQAADFLARAKFANAGQICLSPSRFFVEECIRERFTAQLVAHAKVWRVGDGMDSQTQMGPLANARRLDTVSRLVEDARQRGATVAAGGARIAFTAMHDDERTPSAVQFLYYARLGVSVRLLLTDNGSAFRSKDFAAACKELGVRHRFTRPYRPQTNGKAERFIQSALREWAYGFTYPHSSERTKALDRWSHHYTASASACS